MVSACIVPRGTESVHFSGYFRPETLALVRNPG